MLGISTSLTHDLVSGDNDFMTTELYWTVHESRATAHKGPYKAFLVAKGCEWVVEIRLRDAISAGPEGKVQGKAANHTVAKYQAAEACRSMLEILTSRVSESAMTPSAVALKDLEKSQVPDWLK